MSTTEEKTINAEVSSTSLGDIDGHFSSFVQVEFDGSSQGFGGYNLQGDRMARWVRGITRALGVPRWEDVAGNYCRVKKDGHRLVAIGHITEDKWFHPEEDLA